MSKHRRKRLDVAPGTETTFDGSGNDALELEMSEAIRPPSPPSNGPRAKRTAAGKTHVTGGRVVTPPRAQAKPYSPARVIWLRQPTPLMKGSRTLVHGVMSGAPNSLIAEWTLRGDD